MGDSLGFVEIALFRGWNQTPGIHLRESCATNAKHARVVVSASDLGASPMAKHHPNKYPYSQSGPTAFASHFAGVTVTVSHFS